MALVEAANTACWAAALMAPTLGVRCEARGNVANLSTLEVRRKGTAPGGVIAVAVAAAAALADAAAAAAAAAADAAACACEG